MNGGLATSGPPVGGGAVPAVAESSAYTTLATLALVGLTCVSMLEGTLPGVRYVKYLIGPVVVLLWFLARPGGRYLLHLKDYVLPFLFLAAYMLILLPIGNYTGMKNLFFVLTYMSYFILFPDTRIDIRKINLLIIVVFTPMVLAGVGEGIDVSVTESRASLESTLSLVFGLFAAYFAIQRKYAFFLLNFLAALLTLKRIALLGCVFVLLLTFLPRRVKNVLLSTPVLTAANIFGVVMLVLFAQGEFDGWIREHLGISPSALSLGRYFLYQTVSGDLVARPLDFLWAGFGPGATDQLIAGMLGVQKQIHSDLLRIISELGFVAFVGFIALAYSVASKERRLLTVYINVIFVTGNALIYVDVMVLYLLLISQLGDRPPARPATPAEQRDRPAESTA